jgi:hypothetical protein
LVITNCIVTLKSLKVSTTLIAGVKKSSKKSLHLLVRLCKDEDRKQEAEPLAGEGCGRKRTKPLRQPLAPPYVWLSGYPRWRDGLRPGYVERMERAVGTVEKSF